MRLSIASLALALSLLAVSVTAHATGRLSNRTYSTARAAAIRTGAYELTGNATVRAKLGTMTGLRTSDKGVVSTSPTGVAERHLVVTRKQHNGVPAASVIVSVRKTKAGWVGYTGGSKKVTFAPGF